MQKKRLILSIKVLKCMSTCFVVFKKVNGNYLERTGFIMKTTGIVRKMDELGRIVLPIELRRTLDIAEKDSIEIYVELDKIILKKHQPTCVFCGSSTGIVSYKDKNVCGECIDLLKSI